jgi:predicted DNA-binding transcriptional regulator YafY
MPGLAALDLAALIRDLERALPEPDRAAVAHLVAAQRAIIAQALDGAPDGTDADPPPLRVRLERAIATGTPLTLTYIDTHAQRTQRVVHPRRLEERRGWTYLVADCDLRGEARHFRLDRIIRVT